MSEARLEAKLTQQLMKIAGFVLLLLPTAIEAWSWSTFRHPRAFHSSRTRTRPTPMITQQPIRNFQSLNAMSDDDDDTDKEESPESTESKTTSSGSVAYDLGIGKNSPFAADAPLDTSSSVDLEQWAQNWNIPEPVKKPYNETSTNPTTPFQDPSSSNNKNKNVMYKTSAVQPSTRPPARTRRRMVARDNDSQLLRGALWDEEHYQSSSFGYGASTVYSVQTPSTRVEDDTAAATTETPPSVDEDQHLDKDSFQPSSDSQGLYTGGLVAPARPTKFYPDIDLSIPESVYYSPDGTIGGSSPAKGGVDLVWDLLRWEAYQQAQREPLLVSFLHSTILNHQSLESSLAFLLANRLQSPAMMISTQLQSLIMESLQQSPFFRRSLRADIMAVRDRDPACNCLPDVFLYFKGFHALQSYRVANYMWNTSKQVLALYLQSQVSQIFQIDIHPNATLSDGLMLDHGTGIVIGETVRSLINRATSLVVNVCTFRFAHPFFFRLLIAL